MAGDQKASALKLDLRENGGGDQSIGEHIMATLINKPVPGERSRSTQWIATYRAWGRDQTLIDLPVVTVAPDPARYFAGPVALLISRERLVRRRYGCGVCSGAPGSHNRRATGGSTGQPLFIKLPGGGAARFCTKHDSFADGSEFVGVRIRPDIVVCVTRADIVSKDDPVVEKAIDVAGEAMTRLMSVQAGTLFRCRQRAWRDSAAMRSGYVPINASHAASGSSCSRLEPAERRLALLRFSFFTEPSCKRYKGNLM